MDLNEIEESIRKINYFSEFDSQYFFNSTLIKRNEFIHEKEIRIIYAAGLDFNNDLKHFEISVNEFIESIVLDPRIINRFEKLYKSILIELGFKNEIMKSKLYDFNRLSIEIL